MKEKIIKDRKLWKLKKIVKMGKVLRNEESCTTCKNYLTSKKARSKNRGKQVLILRLLTKGIIYCIISMAEHVRVINK